MDDFNWTSFDDYPLSTCTCRCGAKYQSHARAYVKAGSYVDTVSRVKCPGCSRTDNLRIITTEGECVNG